MSNCLTQSPRPNAQRVGTARSALRAAMLTRGDDFPVCDDAVVDLLADLRHFCIARYIDFARCDRIAESRFETEIKGGAQ